MRLRVNSERWKILGIQLSLIFVVLTVWEVLVRFGVISEFFFGQPSKIIEYLAGNMLNGYLPRQVWVTFYEQVVGFTLGTIVGTVIGLALWWSPYWARVFEPVAIMINATPKIVFAPILIVWFGLGLTSKVMISMTTCFVVAWLGAFEGVRNVDPDQGDMVRAVGGRPWDVFYKIVIPNCLPWILTTARLNIGLALIGVITGEFLSSTEGLGYLIDRTAKQYEMSYTLAALVLIAVMAAAQLYSLKWVEAHLFRWADEPERHN